MRLRLGLALASTLLFACGGDDDGGDDDTIDAPVVVHYDAAPQIDAVP